MSDRAGLLVRWVRRSVARRVAFFAAGLATLVATLVGVVIVQLLLGDQPTHTRRAVMLVALLGGACTIGCVALGTVVIVNRLLAGPLRALTAALHAAEKGRWLKTIDSDRADELGELSRAFDRVSVTVTDLSVSVIDADRELAWTRRELQLKDALSLLFELTQTINAESNLAAILAAVPARISTALGFEQMAVLLLDEKTQEFVVRATHGIAEDALGVSFPRNDPISGKVADTGEPLIIPDTARDPRYSHFRGKHRVDGAFASIPMTVQGRLVGLFNVLRPGAASIAEGDLRLLRSLASYAGLAIAHAEANLRLRNLAVTDELTGLPNRRQLLERARIELARCRRSGAPLALLLLDLDHFKHINDELGHQTGDLALRAVAAALTATGRELDIVARYGGEEFCVLLPESGRTQALAVAEAMRAAVSALDVGRPLTVSLGVALCPDDSEDFDGLVRAADLALMKAKKDGRDRVVSAAPKTASH